MPEGVPQLPPHDNNLDLAIGNGNHNGQVELPPAILRDLLSDAVRYVVRDEDDAAHLRSQGFYELWVPEPDQLDLEEVKPHRRLAVIQRPGEDGTRYGVLIKQQLGTPGWVGDLTRAPLEPPFFDLASLAKESAPGGFAVYIAGLAYAGITEHLTKATPQRPTRANGRPPPTATLVKEPVIDDEPQTCPALPNEAKVDETLAAKASAWLDNYIGFSGKWAPRAFAEFHEACGVFILATTAARRIKIRFGRGVYTSLYLALAGRTTLSPSLRRPIWRWNF
jgi:hypothetical protein